jgi:hypothetical protein
MVSDVSDPTNRLESGALYFICAVLLAVTYTKQEGITFNVLQSTSLHLVVSLSASSYPGTRFLNLSYAEHSTDADHRVCGPGI